MPTEDCENGNVEGELHDQIGLEKGSSCELAKCIHATITIHYLLHCMESGDEMPIPSIEHGDHNLLDVGNEATEGLRCERA